MKINGFRPGKRQITSGLVKWRSVWKPQDFCSLEHFVVVQVLEHPVRHFAKPPDVKQNTRSGFCLTDGYTKCRSGVASDTYTTLRIPAATLYASFFEVIEIILQNKQAKRLLYILRTTLCNIDKAQKLTDGLF